MGCHVLSDKTWADLDMDEVFMFVDRTISVPGQQCLYAQLRGATLARRNWHKEEAFMEKVVEDRELRWKLSRALNRLKHHDAYALPSLFQEKLLAKPSWYGVIPILSISSFVSLLAIPFYPPISIVFLLLFIVNFILHYWNKRNLAIYSRAVPQLFTLHRVAKMLWQHEAVHFAGNEVPQALRSLNPVKRRFSMFKWEARLEGELDALMGAMGDLVKTTFLLEPIFLFGALEKLENEREGMARLFEFVGKVDVLMSIASLRFGLTHPWCRPSLHEEGTLVIEGNELYHPLLVNPVPSSIQIKNQSILLTGSNMSGKTTFIRSIGINCWLAMTLNTCFAKAFRTSYLKVFSAVRISDDLLNDKSYYFEEVLTIREMLEEAQSGTPTLFLLDEIFKGTNTVERIAAGKAVLSSLAAGGNKVLVATHDVELADLLAQEYALYHFSELVTGDAVDFDYQLKAGPLTRRNALRILEINGYPLHVVKEAKQIAMQLDAKKSD